MIYRPMYVDKIMAYADTPFVKVLTGVRRCGKSTILKMIMEKLQTERNIPSERIVNCRYDSMEYEDMTAKQMYAHLKERISPEVKTYLFLDEVQEIKGWEKVVNSLASDFDVDLYVTGSNSRMMSSEISTYLTGRYIAFRIFTLSFSEYLMFKEKYDTVGNPRTELADYVRLGGFPATHHFLRHCEAESSQENRPVGASSQIHLPKCRQHIFRKVDFGLPEIGAQDIG